MKKTIRKLFFVLTILAASVMCLLLYQYNNKYTQKAAQPENGILNLSEQELNEYPLRFLIEDWIFYPDVLLSPSDLQDQAAEHASVCTDIGEFTHFSFAKAKNNPHGQGTYVLSFKLPDTPVVLELPEIFSAYRLYVNEELVLQVGDPDYNTYHACTQTQQITLDGGDVRLILAASDYSHYYSGLVYPPALGTASAVEFYHGMRMLVCAVSCTVMLLLAALSLYLGYKVRQTRIYPFTILCLAMIMFSSYPLLHSLVQLPVFPWYALELSCGYLVMFLIILLHNQICCTERQNSRFSQSTAFVFFLITLLYGLYAPYLTTTVIQVFSACVTVYKLLTAVYLLCTAILAFYQKELPAVYLFYGDIFYGMVLLWDRILPSYEPIYGGWFSECGCIVLIFMILYTLWNDMTQAYLTNLALEEEKRHLARQLHIQQEHYQKLSEKIDESIRRRHDEHHHLNMLSLFLQNEQYDQMESYLKNYQLSYDNTERTVLCHNLVVDAILQYYKKTCQQKGISLTIYAQLPAELPISDTDLTILFGNLLENAYEACLSPSEEERFIHIKTGFQNQKLYLRIGNSFEREPVMKQGKFLSQKRNGFGIGTESVKELVKRQNGQIKFDIRERTFRVSVIL